MPLVYASGSVNATARPMVVALFVSSCLLSIVSWYTTMQGMALYLSGWFALLASLGIQTALVLVAWLVGFTKSRRALLITVYAITAIVSVAFSYVSLYTWFSARERPAIVERQLYDQLTATAAQTEERLSEAVAEAQKHVLALDEMTEAEKKHGYISRAQDADPYLAGVREAVAREARTYQDGYKEGTGEGVRYTAFDRHTKIARQSLAQIQQWKQSVADFRSQLKPADPSDKQLRAYHQVFDTIAWTDIERTLHSGTVVRPEAPKYADFVDRSASGQEDLMLAFTELVGAPTSRHLFSLALAAFIDIVIFLLAYASGPYLLGSPEQRWCAGSAAVDDADDQVFLRDFLRKVTSGTQGTARVEADLLTPGERQLCLVLAGKGLAATVEDDGRTHYLLDPSFQETMLEALSSRSLPLRAAARRAPAGA